MAAAIKRVYSRGITTGQTVYVNSYKIPANTTAAVKGLSLASRNNARASVTVELADTNGSPICAYIENAEIPPGDALIVIGAEQTQFMMAGDQIRVTVHAGTVDAILSIAELS